MNTEDCDGFGGTTVVLPLLARLSTLSNGTDQSTSIAPESSAVRAAVSSAYFTTSFNIGIGGGAFIGGLLLDGYGIGVLPFVDVGVTIVGILLIGLLNLVTDAALAAFIRRWIGRWHGG